MRVKTWRQDPTQLVPSLRALVAHPPTKSTVQEPTTNELLASLQTKLTSKQVKSVKQALQRARTSVARRESAKNVAVTVIDWFRQYMCKLANKLVQDGLLPDPDLVFFLTV